MMTSQYLALAVCFVYAMQICTCATTAKLDSIFAFNTDCLAKHIGSCKQEVDTSLAAVRDIPHILQMVVEECGSAEAKQCLTFNGGIKQTEKCQYFLKNIEQGISLQVDAEMECPER